MTYRNGALCDRRHAVFLISPVLANAVPVNSCAIIRQAVRDMDLQGVSLERLR